MILHLTVKPGCRKDEFIVGPDSSIKVKIKEQPIEGKANKYLLNFLSEVFGVSKSKIEILKGENNPNKKISIEINEDEGKRVISSYDTSIF